MAKHGLDSFPARLGKYREEIVSFSPMPGLNYAALVLPGPACHALIGISSIAITREGRTDSHPRQCNGVQKHAYLASGENISAS